MPPGSHRSFSWPPPPLRCLAKSSNSALGGWYEDHFVTTSPFRNCPHLPTTQCACADFWNFAKKRNGAADVKKIYTLSKISPKFKITLFNGKQIFVPKHIFWENIFFQNFYLQSKIEKKCWRNIIVTLSRHWSRQRNLIMTSSRHLRCHSQTLGLEFLN
jgi:hypothetical protein